MVALMHADPTDYSPDPPEPSTVERLRAVTEADLTPFSAGRILDIISDAADDIEQLQRELQGAWDSAREANERHATLMHKIEQLVF
jgi:hypothetical protein